MPPPCCFRDLGYHDPQRLGSSCHNKYMVRTASFVDAAPGPYQAIATYPGSTLTATATITVTD
jgi:hypothetical protein